MPPGKYELMTTEQVSGKIKAGSSDTRVPVKNSAFALRQKKTLPEYAFC